MHKNLQVYLRYRANLDKYAIVHISSAYGKVGNIYVWIWIKDGPAEFVRTLDLSLWQFYNHSEKWDELYEEIRLELLFGS